MRTLQRAFSTIREMTIPASGRLSLSARIEILSKKIPRRGEDHDRTGSTAPGWPDRIVEHLPKWVEPDGGTAEVGGTGRAKGEGGTAEVGGTGRAKGSAVSGNVTGPGMIT